MKIHWSNVAAVLLVVGGGIGVSMAAIRSSAKTDSSSVATMSESSMVSMTSEVSTCEKCSRSADTPCMDSSCRQSNAMPSMVMDNAMSMGGTVNPMMNGSRCLKQAWPTPCHNR